MAAVVARWVRFYTRKLPTPLAERRADEIGADLHDHIAYERTRGTSDQRIALSILSRMGRGLTADATWRRAQPQKRPKGNPMKRPVAIVTTAILVVAIGVAAIVLGEAGDAPELMLLGILFIVGAVVLGVRTARPSR